MNSETATIQPRSRRRPAHRNEGVAAVPVEDLRTRVLIRVPWVNDSNENRGRTAAGNVAAPASSTTATLPAGSLGATDALPPPAHVTPPRAEPRSFARIDAAHAAIPAPHSAAPAWSQRSYVWLTKLARQPVLWVTGIVAMVVVIVVVFRGGNDSAKARQTAPPANSAKKEATKPSDQAPADSAVDKRRTKGERVARNQPTKAKKPKAEAAVNGPLVADPSPSPVKNPATSAFDQPGLQRRADSNTAASLDGFRNTSPSEPAIQPPDSLDSRSNLFGPFRLFDERPPVLPPVQATPPTDQSGGYENGDPRAAARFTGEIGHHTYR